MLKVQIFFEELNVEMIKEQKSYGVSILLFSHLFIFLTFDLVCNVHRIKKGSIVPAQLSH